MRVTDSTIRNISEAVNRTLNNRNALLRVLPVGCSYRIAIDEDEDGYYSFYKGNEDKDGGHYDSWRQAYDALIKEKVQPAKDGYMPKIVYFQNITIITEKEVD